MQNLKKFISIGLIVLTLCSVLGITASATNHTIKTGVGVVDVATGSNLRLRANASTSSKTLAYAPDGEVVIVEGKVGDWYKVIYNLKEGYMHSDYLDVTNVENVELGYGVVNDTQVNIRSGPGTGYGSVGSYYAGDSIKILEQFTYNGKTWGCTNKGWVSMDYVDVSGNGGNTSNAENTDSNGNKTGTVIGNGLNIRSGAGSDYPAVGSLNYDDRVTILEQKKVGDTTWGKTSKGWVSLDYVSLD